MSPYLEQLAETELELQEVRDELAGVTAQRDEMKRQLTIALEKMTEPPRIKGGVKLRRIIEDMNSEASFVKGLLKSRGNQMSDGLHSEFGNRMEALKGYAHRLEAALDIEPQPQSEAGGNEVCRCDESIEIHTRENNPNCMACGKLIGTLSERERSESRNADA